MGLVNAMDRFKFIIFKLLTAQNEKKKKKKILDILVLAKINPFLHGGVSHWIKMEGPYSDNWV